MSAMLGIPQSGRLVVNIKQLQHFTIKPKPPNKVVKLESYVNIACQHFPRNILSRKLDIPKSEVRYLHVSRKLSALLHSPQNVTDILRANEYNKELSTGSVKAFDSNQLPSNSPIEDTRCEAQCLLTTGLLVGIFDGHGGGACAQVISKRLFHYIAACLLPPDIMDKYVKSSQREELILSYNDKVDIVEDIKPIYKKSFDKFLHEMTRLKCKESFEMQTALESAFLGLDLDLSNEVLDEFNVTGNVNKKILSVALSGAVACVAHIDGPHLHVANVGDSNAVLGVLSENNDWIAKKITTEHNAENMTEVLRIQNEHPLSEKDTVIKLERLLGQLAPLRSLGDFRYKWSTEVMENVVVPFVGPQAVPPDYYTPPYLSAKPEVYYHKLTPRDKFLVIASDGLWDMMTPLQAVKLVGEHMLGKVFFTPLKLPRKNMILGDIHELLLHRTEGLKSKPKDKNAATHLLRHALGGTEYGIEHSRLSEMLSLPADVSRMFRDDISITVVYFDTDYLRNCPA